MAARPEDAPLIHVEHLTKRYRALAAVDDLSFDVSPGETFALVGPNGAGKTTTLKVLLGLVRPDAGRVALGPRALPPSDPRARHEIGYVPQRSEFPPGRTVPDVLRFFADLRGLPADAAGRAIDRVGLASHAGRRAGELSGGYLQRLALAQALLGDPALLVLDEPTASLDPEATWEFRSLVQSLQKEGKTILLCSHLLAEVERVADRVLILVAGQRVAEESLADFRARQGDATRLVVEIAGPVEDAHAALRARALPFTSAGERAVAVDARNGHAGDTLETLRRAGVAIRSFELVRPTLEELFLAVVRGGRTDA